MYKRPAQRVDIYQTHGGHDAYLRAVLILHESWLEVKGFFVWRDYKPKTGMFDPASRGSVKPIPINRIYPESAIKYIEIDGAKIDMRKYKKESSY